MIDQITVVRNWVLEAPVEGDELELPLVADSDVLLFMSCIIPLSLNIIPIYRNEKVRTGLILDQFIDFVIVSKFT